MMNLILIFEHFIYFNYLQLLFELILQIIL